MIGYMTAKNLFPFSATSESDATLKKSSFEVEVKDVSFTASQWPTAIISLSFLCRCDNLHLSLLPLNQQPQDLGKTCR